MRILFVTHFFPPTHWAGTEIYTYKVAKELQEQGHSVRVLCAEGWTDGSQYWNGSTDGTFDGIPVTRLSLNWRLAPDPFGYLYRNPVVQSFVEGFLVDTQPDLVHLTSAYSLSGSVIEAAKRHPVPIVVTLADFWFVCPRVNLIHANGEECDGLVCPWECIRCKMWDSKAYRLTSKAMPEPVQQVLFTWIGRHPALARQRGLRGMVGDIADRRAYLIGQLNQANLVILPSAFLRERFTDHGVDPDRIRVLPWGVDRDWARTMSRREQYRASTIGYIGRIVPIKGVHVLIQAFLKLKGPGELHIYGGLDEDADYVNTLGDLVGEDLRVKFCGRYSYNQLGDVLSSIDVLVVPSICSETFCLTAREGIIAGIPVVASRIGAIPEAISHGEDGFLFSPGNVEELASYLHLIMSDPVLWRRLRQDNNSVKTVGQEVRQLMELYATVVRNDGS